MIVTTIARVVSAKRLILMSRLYLLGSTVWTLLAARVVLCLGAWLRGITPLSICWGVSVRAVVRISLMKTNQREGHTWPELDNVVADHSNHLCLG